MRTNDKSTVFAWLRLIAIATLIMGLGWFIMRDTGQTASVDDRAQQSKENGAKNGDGEAGLDDSLPEFGQVTDIVDSITVVIDKKYFVRYLGVVTPTTIDKVQCMGREALLANESTMNQIVRMEKDPIIDQAKDGVWLRYVWVADDEATKAAYNDAFNGTAAFILDEPINEPTANIEPTEQPMDSKDKTTDQPSNNVNPSEDVKSADEPKADDKPKHKEFMVSDRIIEMGLGFPLLSKDMKYYDKMSSTAHYSSATKHGLWGQCEISQDDKGLLKTQTVEECNIKGIKTKSGDKIYRVPDCPLYQRAVVLKYQDDEWLCSEDEATTKGYKKATDCN